MAYKKFAFYNKGNKIAIIQESLTGGGGVLAVAHCTLGGTYTTKDTCEAAGGQWIPSSGSRFTSEIKNRYTSPVQDISEGLELEYTYAPIFNLQSGGQDGTDYIKFLGWGSDGTNLLLFTSGNSSSNHTNYDLSSVFLADDWIHIDGSGRWSGLHQVKSNGSTGGILTLKTKCNLSPSKITATVNFSVDETLAGVGQFTDDLDIEGFKDEAIARKNPWIFIENAATEGTGGMNLVDLTYSSQGGIKFLEKVFFDASRDVTRINVNMGSAISDEVTIYNAFYDTMSVRKNIEIMDNEDFELDLSRQQSKAVVHYVKAQVAEDKGEMDLREFHMRIFRREVDQLSGSRTNNLYISQGNKNMLKW